MLFRLHWPWHHVNAAYSVCDRLGTEQYTAGGQELRCNFKPFVDEILGQCRAPLYFPMPCLIVYITFRLEDICHLVSKSLKTKQM